MKLALIALALVAAPPPADVVPMAAEPLHGLRAADRNIAIYDVNVPPGATMRWHAHPTAHLAVPIDTARLRNEVVGAEPVEHRTPPGTIVFLPAGPVHRQSNIDTRPARFIAVEFLAPTGARNPLLPATFKTEIDNASTTVARLTLKPGATATLPAFNQAVLLLAISQASVDTGGTRWAATAGATRTIAANSASSIVNRGAADAHLVLIAPK